MTEETMEDTRLVQIFLSQANTPGPGIYEVSLTGDKKFICTCPGYNGRSTCKHTKFVEARVKNNNGTYPLEISTRSKDEDTDRAMESPESFREFIIKYGKIEVC
jgi:hypothetical protein